MSGHVVWWQNRKSKMGSKPSAKEPPHLPNGQPWWTTPPIAKPEPEHIEYASNYLSELLAIEKEGKKTAQRRKAQALARYVSEWLRRARQILHERQHEESGDLATTDGLIVAASNVHTKMASVLREHGLAHLVPDMDRVNDALRGKKDEIARRRAMDPSRWRA